MGLSNIPGIANGSVPINGSIENITQKALEQTAGVLFSSVFTRIVWAFVILLISLILGKIAEKALYRFLAEFDINAAAEKFLHMPMKLDALIAGLVGYVIYIFGIILALNTLSLTGIALNTIAIIVMILVIVLVFLGLKDFIPNSIAGLIMHAKRSFREGDFVSIGKISGTVRAFELLQTRIEAKNKDIIHIPNSFFFTQNIKVVYKQHRK